MPLVTGEDREDCQKYILYHHYTHSIPAGKSLWFEWDAAIVCYSIPANNNIAKFLLWKGANVWELSRLWAPNKHSPNLLTQAISHTRKEFCSLQPCDAIVSYADPNVGHSGGVYKAASWIFTGQSEESRYYLSPEGKSIARRKFHSGKSFIKKAEIEALGYKEVLRPGKLRFAYPVTRAARRTILQKFGNV